MADHLLYAMGKEGYSTELDKAHPAKAGAAKPRVLASSATLSSRHEGP